MALLHIPLQDIKEATKNFTTLITKDRCVCVYKGELSLSGKLTTVIIERISNEFHHCGLLEKFLSQRQLQPSIYEHSNVVSLLGSCQEDNEGILIYEYPEGGSLDEYLNNNNKTNDHRPLSWMQRLDICIDAARVLDFLHQLNVFHGHFTSPNVLLTQNLKAMVVYLALSKMMFAYNYNLVLSSETSDVYSFGEVLFDVLFGKSPAHFSDDMLARNYYKEGRLNQIIDFNLKNEQVDAGSLNRFSEIAYQCIQSDSGQQPSMGLVVKKLEEIRKWQGILLQVQDVQHLKIPLEDILSATKNFHKSHLIGTGGYGQVYKAELKLKSKHELLEKPDVVAIKRIFSREDDKGKEGFVSELDVLSRCKHPNVVSLLGFCVEVDEMLLVYEYVPNGSLDDYLTSIDMMSDLTWATRLKMCIDIAQGLKYMHTSMEDRKGIIHRDLKSANILLGKNWEAKIADFGLSKVHHMNQGVSTINTQNVAGTEFYLDPEYARTGRLKKASDIYSFGVVLFEIFSGKLAYDSSYIKKNVNGLAPIARRHFINGTLKEILDPKIMDDAHELGFTGKIEPDHDSLDVFARIAYQCVAKTQAERPTIKIVIEELEKALHFQENQIKSLKVSRQHIRLGVEDFSDDNGMMKGGYGRLYKGKVQYNNRDEKVGLKLFVDDENLSNNILLCRHGFLKEFEVLFKYKHENIIGLVGYCTKMEENIIVYEHASKGRLNKYLNDASFSWTERLKVCIDIAKGLKFLHGGDEGVDVVLHRNIKSSNILLNKVWKAKICGFESAITYPTYDQENEIEYVIDNVEGSLGYSDPLFHKTHFLTKESDIYSFGVILFEILCGRLACPEDFTDNSQFLDVVIKQHIQEASLDEIVFKGIKEQIGPESLAKFRKIAFQCLLDERKERPTAGYVKVQLQEALKLQEAYETQEAKLYINDKELSKSLRVSSAIAKKEIYNILSKTILFEDHKQELIRALQLRNLYLKQEDSDDE